LERLYAVPLARRVLDDVREEQGVAVVLRDVLRAPYDLGEVGVRNVGDEQADGARGGLLQTPCDDVGAVSQAVDGALDALAGPRSDARALVHDPGDGHLGHAL